MDKGNGSEGHLVDIVLCLATGSAGVKLIANKVMRTGAPPVELAIAGRDENGSRVELIFRRDARLEKRSDPRMWYGFSHVRMIEEAAAAGMVEIVSR